jgi:hydroxymethylglutaryl-CoA lyase
MADTDEFIKTVRHETPGVLITALVLNDKGLERALKCGLGHLSMSHRRQFARPENVRSAQRGAFDSLLELIRQAVRSGMQVRAGVSVHSAAHTRVVAEDRVIEMAARLAETAPTNSTWRTPPAWPTRCR